MQIRRFAIAAAASAGLCMACFAVSVRADVTGHCKLDGKAPEPKMIDMSAVPDCAALHPDPIPEEKIVADDKGDLANVVVTIKKDDSPNLACPVPKDGAVLDQKGCMFHPHVLAMMAGQDLVVKNSDSFLHNFHTISEDNPSINKAQPTKNDGETMDDSPKIPETIRVKCDVHPWMSAYICVLDNPYFDVSNDKGEFTIKGLPDGNYTLTAWQEILGTQEKKITVKDGKATEDITFSFKPQSALAPAAGDPVLASATTQPTKMASCCVGLNKAKAMAAAK